MIVKSREIVEKIKQEQKDFFANFEIVNGKKVILCIIKVGENKISENYVKIKKKYAENIEVEILEKNYPSDMKGWELILEIENLNITVDGIIIQLPLPKNLDTEEIISEIDKNKDIDKLQFVKSSFVQPVVFAIINILNHNNVDYKNENKKIVILGNGNLVGRPFSEYLKSIQIDHIVLDKNSEKEFTNSSLKTADILITGIGVGAFVKKEMLKTGVVIIDAGTSEDGDSIVGDVDLECDSVASIFSSTPGGVGPLTVCGLFENLKIAVQNNYK